MAAKVHFTNDLRDLEEYIPRDHIIKELGGPENWEYKYIEPSPDENAQMQDTERRDRLLAAREETAQEYQRLTQEWIAAASSGESTDEIKSKRDGLARSLKQGYWELDPFLRARSWYDRTGTVQGDGKIDFYPPKEAAPKATEPANGDVQQNANPDDVD